MKTVKTTRKTFFKSRPIQSSELAKCEKLPVEVGVEFQILFYEKERSHFKLVPLHIHKDFKDYPYWYAYEKHIEIYENGQKVYPRRPDFVRLEVPYKSQLDNRYHPLGTCNVTAIAMCLKFFGVEPKDPNQQFEDELYEYAKAKGFNYQSPYDLARIVRDYGHRDTFKANAKIEEVKDWLASGNPCVFHGYFTDFGHIVTAVGFDDTGFFIHDPYGEWFSTGYRTDLSGAYLHYSYRLIRRVCMPDGDFWVHFISR